MEQSEAKLRALEVLGMHCLPMAVKTLVKLKVLDAMADLDASNVKDDRHAGARGQAGLHSVEAIVSRIDGALHRGVDRARVSAELARVLRLVASHGVLRASENIADPVAAKYGLNPISRHLVNDSFDKESLAPMLLLMMDMVVVRSLDFLDQAIVEGAHAFSKAHDGLDLFAYAEARNPRYGSLFNSAMAHYSSLLIQELLRSSFSAACLDGVHVLVDVGGGIGSMLNLIVSRFPHIHGINFDQPHVIAQAPSYPGVKHIGGDMFVDIPQADTIFMKWILHDWDDEQCVKILKNCYKALSNNGKVIVLEEVLPTGIKSDLRARVAYNMDLTVLATCPGGRERSKEEFEYLARAAGFARLDIKHKLTECCVIEIYKF